MNRILLLVSLFLITLPSLGQKETKYCYICRRKIDSTNAYINGIPHQFYERLELAVTNAILNYKSWFSLPGPIKADFLTDDSRHQTGDVLRQDMNHPGARI